LDGLGTGTCQADVAYSLFLKDHYCSTNVFALWKSGADQSMQQCVNAVVANDICGVTVYGKVGTCYCVLKDGSCGKQYLGDGAPDQNAIYTIEKAKCGPPDDPLDTISPIA
jgi:hypothetical protein